MDGAPDGLRSPGVAKSRTQLSTHALAVKRQHTEYERKYFQIISLIEY